MQVFKDQVLDKHNNNPNIFEGSICGRDGRVAVKRLPLASIINEFSIMQQFERRENFINLFGLVETDDECLLLMEKCDATLLDVIQGTYSIPIRNGSTKENGDLHKM